jgi:glucose-1-phosphate thymidylyltransferase
MRKQEDGGALDAQQAKVAETGVKALIPIDRPFLDYVLHVLAESGYRRACLVIGPEHEAVREYYGKTVKRERLEFSFAIQEKPMGTADAVAAAEQFAGNDPFLMINSDNHYPREAVEGLRKIGGNGLAGFDRTSLLAGSNIPADRIAKFAAIEATADGNLKRIVEKPDEATLKSFGEHVLLSMNCWMFTTPIFRACTSILPSPRGEYEITDAVQYAIDHLRQKFRVLTVHAPVLDMSFRGDIPSVAKRLAGTEVRL